jgi:hypothetical protein
LNGDFNLLKISKYPPIFKYCLIFSPRLACATVSFAELASANIVGYSTTALQAGFKAAGASFISIGKDGCNLTEIVPTGFDKTTGGVQIQLLNNAGVTTTTYKYYKGGRGTYATDGWYDGTTLITADNDVTFAHGDGLWVYGADGYTITFSVGTESAE